MYLGGMPRLKHVRLDNCLPGRELALPADCSLFLDGSCYDDRRWHLGKVKDHTIVLRLLYRGLYLQWPQEIHSFSSLQYLELEMQQVWGGDLATLRHIPHVRVILEVGGDLGLTAGSWETLEVFCFGELRVGMSDMDSFVRDTRNFTFMGLSLPPYRESTVLLLQIHDACLRQGKACHVCRHYDMCCGTCGATYDTGATHVTLNTNKEMAESFPDICSSDLGPKISFGRGKTLAERQDFWPSDPCECMKRA